MIDTDDVRKELDAILEAFRDYIDGQNYFDIAYSRKLGYLWLVVDPPAALGVKVLDTPHAMLDALFYEIVDNVISSPENISRCSDSPLLTAYEVGESRRRIAAILEKIKGGGDEYLEYLEQYIRNYQESHAGDDECVE